MIEIDISAQLNVNVNAPSTSGERPPYELIVDDFPDNFFRVRTFEGKENISHAYRFEIVATAHAGGENVQQGALRKRARFVWNVGKSERDFYGVISSIRVEPLGDVDGALKYHLILVPRLWLLKRIKRTRIYQNLRVPDVVTAVLLEMGIGVRWQLLRQYPVREYVTQYEETNYAFVRRLLAEAGIFFYFAQGGSVDPAALAAASVASAVGSVASGVVSDLAGSAMGSVVGSIVDESTPLIPGDTVICGDDATFYPGLGPDDAGALAAESAAALAPEAAEAIGGAFGGLDPMAGAAIGAASAVAGAVIGAATSKSAPPLYYFTMHETTRSHYDKVLRFGLANSVASNAANFRDRDFQKPALVLNSAAVSSDPFPPSPFEVAAAVAAQTANAMSAIATGPLGGLMGGAAAPLAGAASMVASATEAVANTVGTLTGAPGAILEVYDHHGPFRLPVWPFSMDEAPRMLRQERRRASIASGESGCCDLAPAHRFTLLDHPVSDLDQPYVVTSVQHRGQAHPQPGVEWRIYVNSFECAPASMTYCPPRPKRESVQVMLTATVVGPPGEEIYVDPMGQIKVQFHWDREGVFDDKSSCWIRVMQPWGGVAWGHQFIPRVGMEVVVTFEGGDPDKPLVLGSVYNGIHPPPFLLPDDKTRSGIRTQSSPGGGGFNELSFEDAAGQEQIYIHAQKNRDEVVENDGTMAVGHNETDTIGNDLSESVGDNRTRSVGNNEQVSIGNDRAITVSGNHDIVTQQVKRELVGGDSHLHITGERREKYDQMLSVTANSLQMKVGSTYAIESDGQIHIKSGASIVIEAPDVSINGAGGFVRIDGGGVTIKGSLVKINSGGSAGSASANASPKPPDDPKPPQSGSSSDPSSGDPGAAPGASGGSAPGQAPSAPSAPGGGDAPQQSAPARPSDQTAGVR